MIFTSIALICLADASSSYAYKWGWELSYDYKGWLPEAQLPLWHFYYYGSVPCKFIHQILGFRLNQYFKPLLMNRALLWTP